MKEAPDLMAALEASVQAARERRSFRNRTCPWCGARWSDHTSREERECERTAREEDR